MHSSVSAKRISLCFVLLVMASASLLANGLKEHYQWPTPKEMSQVWLPYGFIKHPFTNLDYMNPGVYLLCREDTPITAIADGQILYIEESHYNDLFLGQEIAVYHEEGITSHYSSIRMNNKLHVGQRVRKGDVLGWATENSHYGKAFIFLEVTKGKPATIDNKWEWVDPMTIIDAKV